MSSTIADKLVKECRRQEESCLYTSTTLYVWLRKARWWRRIFISAPIVLGAIASWSILGGATATWAIWSTAIAGLLAGVFPAVRDALGLDLHVDEIARQAAEFKSLQDRFRLVADTGAHKPGDAFETEVRDLIERLDDARKASSTPSERCFKAAREKIHAGHYSFSVDTRIDDGESKD